MASCDVFSCVRHLFTSEEEFARKAEENAETLSTVYGSHVIETQCALDETIKTAKANLKALAGARAQNNPSAVARATANARASAARVRDLTNRIDKYTQQQQACDRAVHGLREGRQMKTTVGALAAVQRQLRSLRLGGLNVTTERTVADMEATNEELGNIRAILGAPMEQQTTDPDADMRELEALIMLEDPVVVDTAPGQQHIEPARPIRDTGVKLPSVEAYALALATN